MARQPQRPTHPAPHRHRPLRIEGLEQRSLLSATPIDLGTIDYREVADVDPSTGDVWYSLKTSMAGFLSASAANPAAPETLDFTLYDSSGTEVLARSRDFLSTERLDWNAPAGGETYLLQVSGSATDVDLALLNRVRLTDNVTSLTVAVFGTSGDDTFAYTAQDFRRGVGDHWVSVEQLQYRFRPSVRGGYTENNFTVTFNGGGGNDAVELTGGSGDEVAELSPGGGAVLGTNFEAKVSDVDAMTVRGTAGYDLAVLYGSPGDDVFTGTARESRLAGADYNNLVLDFDMVSAIARRGGTDTARFYGTAGNDTFVARPHLSRLSGPDYTYSARYFDFVHAYGRGGADLASMFDSDGDDVFVAAADSAKMYGDGYFYRVFDFPTVYGRSTGLGNDVAVIHDTSASDRLEADLSTATLWGRGQSYAASGFSTVTAISSHGGYDVKRVGFLYFEFTSIGPWHNR